MDHPTHVDPPKSVRTLGDLLALSMTTPLPLRASCRDGGIGRDLWLVAGEFVHARYGALRGAPAVWALLDEPARDFAVEYGREAPVRSLHTSWGRLCHQGRCMLADQGEGRVGETWVDIAVDDLGQG